MYKVLISKTAEKQLKKLPKDVQRKIAAAISSFKIEPRPFGSKKLSNYDCLYRYRVGNYRIIYEVIDEIVTVTVLKVRPKKRHLS